jgi:Lar family restriction alleviation protein
MSELKPCPFCGGAAEADYGYYDYNLHGVHCSECGAYVSTMKDDPEDAAQMWNRRATDV